MKPMIFNSEMIRAVLDGRKTMTRRIVKPQPTLLDNAGQPVILTDPKRKWQVGDKLWVRETFAPYEEFEKAQIPYIYRADFEENFDAVKWKPSIFMPRKASRITLEITNIRVEKVKDMTEGDAIAEGIVAPPMIRTREQVEQLWFDWRCLWNGINAARGYSWGKNPWVWVIEFRRIDK